MTPPTLLALGAGPVACALTASACLFGWPARLRQGAAPPRPPGFPDLPLEQRVALLAVVPEGHSVLVQSVPDPQALAWANAALDLLAAEGRIVESLVLRAPGSALDRH